MLTTRNQNIVAQARSAVHYTSEAAIARFVADLPFGQVAKVEPVARELYGTIAYVPDEQGLARAWARAGMGRGFELALTALQARIECAARQ